MPPVPEGPKGALTSSRTSGCRDDGRRYEVSGVGGWADEHYSHLPALCLERAPAALRRRAPCRCNPHKRARAGVPIKLLPCGRRILDIDMLLLQCVFFRSGLAAPRRLNRLALMLRHTQAAVLGPKTRRGH